MNHGKIVMFGLLVALCVCACSSDDNNESSSKDNNTSSSGSTSVESADVLVYTTTANKNKLLAKSGLSFNSVSDMSPYIVYIDRSQTYQTMDGFGGAITGATCYNLMHMSQGDRTAFLTDMFDTETGIGSSFVRVCIGASDFPASGENFTWCDTEGIENFGPPSDDVEYLIPVLKEIYAINPNVRIIGSPWSAPRWMKDPEQWILSTLKEECYEVYAEYLVKWVQYMEGEGFNIYAITPQNEPLNPANSISMYLTWQQERDLVKNALGPAFEKAGLKTKIVIFDHTYDYSGGDADQDGYPLHIYADADANKYVAGSAWHAYGGSPSTLDQINYEYPDKEIFFTEASIGDWNYSFSGCLLEDMETIFYGTISRMGKGVTLWNLMLDENNGPHYPSSLACETCYGVVDILSSNYKNLTYNSQYYDIAQASLVVKQDAVRIGTSGYETTKLYYLVFENPDKSIGVIILNENSSDKTLEFVEDDYMVRVEVPAESVVSLIWKR